jgi:2-dehydro-3-deoxyphosphogluconate aldolase/(4S)-4-hydroxy-2-oxoglutarate aldolase
MNQTQLFEELEKYAVIPVIAIDDVDSACFLADALIEGGLPVAEITFRTAAARDVIGTLTVEKPELILGAGTVLTTENLQSAVDCGARFGVAPGLNAKIVKEARNLGLPFIPGVVTPGEIETALSLNAKLLKFFPAEASGGIEMLKALSGPYAHTGVRFVPTGGVTIKNLEAYLSLATVRMAGGTWIAGRQLIDDKNWDAIRDNCRQVCELVGRIREKNV